MTNLIVNSITPLEKRPIHQAKALEKGLPEDYETVFVIRGFSDGHIHAPLISGSRYFRPFARHISSDTFATLVQVKRDDKTKPFNPNEDLDKYEGIIDIYENVTRAVRPVLGRDKHNKPIWVTRELKLTLLEAITGMERELHLKDVLAWRSGSDPTQPQPSKMIPYCLKAVELTTKEIEEHTAQAKRHARVPL